MRNKKGFTLVEVMIVLVIMAIVSVVAIPSVSGFMDMSHQRNCRTACSNLTETIKNTFTVSRVYEKSVEDHQKYISTYIKIALMKSIKEPIDPYEIAENEYELPILCERGTIKVKWSFSAETTNSNTAVTTLPVKIEIQCSEHEKNAHDFSINVQFKDYVENNTEPPTEQEVANEYAYFISDKVQDYLDGRVIDKEKVLEPFKTEYTYTDSDGTVYSADKEINPVYMYSGHYEKLNNKEQFFDTVEQKYVSWKQIIETEYPEEALKILRNQKHTIWFFLQQSQPDHFTDGSLVAYALEVHNDDGTISYVFYYSDGKMFELKNVKHDTKKDKDLLCYYAYNYREKHDIA